MKMKIINTALSPNLTGKDLLCSLMMLLPWEWPRLRRGHDVAKLEETMKKRLGSDFTVAVGSGREALQLAISALPIPPRSDILVQSFTCMVVVNAILWAGHRPVFVDIDQHYNLDPRDLEGKCGQGAAAVIIQHTFGIPAQTRKIQQICRSKKLFLVEDCAHALGAIGDNGQAGTVGDIAIFSFGRSKVISAVNGGLVSVNNAALAAPLRLLRDSLKTAPLGWTIQNLLHPPVTALAKSLYWSPLGKAVMVISQKLRLINLEVTPDEKKSIRPTRFVSLMPNAMARLALAQLKRLDYFNSRRRQSAEFYFHNLKIKGAPNPAKFPGAIFLRYPLQVKNPRQVMARAKKAGIILGDWYSTPVAPCDIDRSKTGYRPGSCPRCEEANARMVNLPTHHSLTARDRRRIVQIINDHAES